MSDTIATFVNSLRAMGKEHIKVQTCWAVVDTVNKPENTMVAIGVTDELPYNNVLLGLGGTVSYPKVGSKCLLGMIENLDAATFLIMAEEIDEMRINGVGVLFNGGDNGGLVIVGKLENNQNKITNYLTGLKNATRTALVAVDALLPGTSTAFEASMAAYTLNLENMENTKVKH